MQFEGFRHQHRNLHVRGRTQTVRVFVAVGPHDLVGQRFSSEEENMLLLGVIGERQARIRQEAAEQQLHALARDQFLRDPHRVARVSVVVARDNFELLAEHPA